MHATKKVGLSERNISVSNYGKMVALLCSNLFFYFANAQVVTIKVTFASSPTFATSSFADLKYNKQAVFNLDIDDQPANVMSVLAYLQGGIALEDGKNYPGKFFTDGCGNKKPYTAAVATTAHSNYNDGDLTLVPSLLNASQLTKLVAADFMLENHGFYHERDQYYVINNFNEVRNIVENANFIYAKTGFVPRVWVTPSNNTGYNPYVEQQGYLAATSQGVTDGYTSHPVNMWTDHLADISKLDTSFNVFLRDFTDDWANTTTTDQLKSFVTGLKNKSSSSVHKLYRLGTHSYNSGNWNGFKSFINHLDSVSNDAIWVTSLQELLEYLEVKRLVAKTETLNGNVLTIALDLSKIPTNNRFTDMSLLINGGAEISSVTVSGADNFSYNNAGLINIFKKKIVADPPYSRPIAIAGPDQEIILPESTVQLNGSVFDTTMRIDSFTWARISGPQAGTIISPFSASTKVTGLTVPGVYTYRLTVADRNGVKASDEVSITVNAAPGSTTRIEAENWTAMSGVVRETTTDVGGGQSVGYIDPGDWMEYSYTAPSTGTYTVSLRLATPADGSQLQIRTSSGTVLATVNIPNTGGWQTWQTVSVTLSLPQGPQTLRIVSTSPQYKGWNINWWELAAGGSNVVNQPPTVNAGADQTITLPANSVQLTGTAADADGSVASYAWSKVSGPAATIASPSSASTTVTGLVQGVYTFRLTVSDDKGATAFDEVSITVNAAPGSTTRIEAENWTAMSGVVRETTTDVGGGQSVGYIDPGDWMEYSYTAPSTGTYTVSLRLATPADGGQLQIRTSSGTVLATVNIPNTGGWQSWQTVSVTLSLPQGPQTLRIVSTSPQYKGWNINWWELAAGGANITQRRASAPTPTEVVAASSFEVFPNPAKDRLTLSINNSYEGKMKVQILNMIGAVQKQFSLNKANGTSINNLNIGDLPKGQYILLVEVNGHKETKKFIKQ